MRSSHGFAALAALILSASQARALDVAVATPPVDRSIYREGAVMRTDRRYGAWILTCDEIASLSRKFCSLRGRARRVDGTVIAEVAVSTDDGGRPAALITLPLGTILSSGVMVLKPGAGRRAPVELGLRPTLCDGRGCEVIWSLAAEDIRILSGGAPLRITFAMAAPGSPSFHLETPMPAAVAVVGVVPTEGFAEALKASLQ